MSFAKWANPWIDEIPTNQIAHIYSIFLPMQIYGRSARRFMDYNQAPDIIDAATAYSTALQLLGECMRFLPHCGTAPKECRSTFLWKSTDGQTISLPKARFLLQLVTKDTMPHMGESAMERLPQYELFSPNNQFAIQILIIVHDPELRLADMLEAVVAETATNKPPERQAHLVEELKAAEALQKRWQPRDDDDTTGENEDKVMDDGDVANEDAMDQGNDILESAGRGGGTGAKKGEKKREFKQRPQKYISSMRKKRFVPRSSKKDPVDSLLTYEDIDEMWRAIGLLIDVATGADNVSGNRKYMSRSDLMMALKGTDPNVNLETQLSLDNTLRRMRDYAARAQIVATSEQLFSISYQKAVVEPRDDAGAIDEFGMPVTPPTDCEETDGPIRTRFFRVPVPALVWELSSQQCAARELLKATFPWRQSNPGTIFAMIAARHLDVSVHTIMELANVGGIVKKKARQDQEITNAGRVASIIGVHRPGTSDRDELAGGANMLATDADWIPRTNTNTTYSISKIRPLGWQASAVNSAVRVYVARKTAELKREIQQLENGIDPQQLSSIDRQASGDDDWMDDAAWSSFRRKRRRVDTDAMIVDAAVVSTEIQKRQAMIAKLKDKSQLAVAEIQEAAIVEMVTLLETSTAVPESDTACAEWIACHPDMTLDYDIAFKDIGMVGQLAASSMMTFKMMDLATGQWPMLFLLIARNTGYVSHVFGSLAIHPLLHGTFGGGKSRLLSMLSKLSIWSTINSVTGSSAMGMLPIYTDDSRPIGDVMIAMDESHPMFTARTGKIPAALQSASREMAAFMTKGMCEHMTVAKAPDGELRSTKRVIVGNIPIAGATNERRSGAAIQARMVNLYLQPNVRGPRNAMNRMCNPDTACNRNAGEYARIELTMKTHQTHCMYVSKGIEGGGLPLPESTEYYLNMETAVEFLQMHYPEQAERVRMLDVGHSMAVALTLLNAVAMVYSKGYRPLDADGNPIETPATTEMYDIMKMRNAIIAYLRIDPDVTMWVVAYVVYNSSRPEANSILRWLACVHGHYPFVSTCKKAMRIEEEAGAGIDEQHDMERIRMRQLETELEGQPRDVAAARKRDVYQEWDSYGDMEEPPPPVQLDDGTWHRIRHLRDVVRDLKNCIQCGIVNIPTDVGRATEKRNGANVRARASRARNSIGTERLTVEQAMLLNYYETEGPTVTLTSDGRRGTKAEMEQIAVDILRRGQGPRYEYKQEPVALEGHVYMFYNPNYIYVPGSIESLSRCFVDVNRGRKLTEEQVRDELYTLAGSSIMAHVLPLVPIDQKNLLKEIEAYRIALWSNPRVSKLASSPVVVRSGRPGIYILIEALLDTPRHIVEKVLRHLCNETTVERRVIIPIPYRQYPEVFRVFHARPVARKLRCGNSGHIGAGIRAVPRRVREQAMVSGSNNQDCVLEWGIGSELRCLRRFFRENGVFDKDPASYTYEALYNSVVKSRQEYDQRAHDTEGLPYQLCKYPEDMIESDARFDREAKAAARWI